MFSPLWCESEAFCKEYRQVAPPVSLSRGAFLDGEMAGK